MVEILPNYINTHATFYLNPNGEQNDPDFLYPEYPIDASLNLNIPLNKIAIELNEIIVDKKKIKNIILKKDDKIEIVHFIGGG